MGPLLNAIGGGGGSGGGANAAHCKRASASLLSEAQQ